MKTLSLTTKELTRSALCTALIAVCSWIVIPTPTVPFTMQTFAVFLCLFFLGGKMGTLSILCYLLLGAVGAPVFAGFSGGIGVLFGSTGGYLLGFLATALVYHLCHVEGLNLRSVLVMVLGLFLCYGFGTMQFVLVYGANVGEIGIFTALSWCVIPYILPDLIKLALAWQVAKRLHSKGISD